MVLVGPEDGEHEISTERILSYIDEHAAETALVLLPGIQYYTGQFFDIPKITAHAQFRGLVVGWDLAHAYANVVLNLHDWNVDFAAWCTYKYGNAGPGAMAGLFVHERHGQVDYSAGEDAPRFRHRLTGWYGGDRSVRFKMDNSKFGLCTSTPPASETDKTRVQAHPRRRRLPALEPVSRRPGLALRGPVCLR